VLTSRLWGASYAPSGVGGGAPAKNGVCYILSLKNKSDGDDEFDIFFSLADGVGPSGPLGLRQWLQVTTEAHCCWKHSGFRHCHHCTVSSHHTADTSEYTFHYCDTGTSYLNNLYSTHTNTREYHAHRAI